MAHGGNRYNVAHSSNNTQMSFNNHISHPQQQPGMMSAWTVSPQPSENEFPPYHQQMTIDQTYQGTYPPTPMYPVDYFSPSPPLIGPHMELYIPHAQHKPQPPPQPQPQPQAKPQPPQLEQPQPKPLKPLKKEAVGRAHMLACSNCTHVNYLCEIQMSKMDEEIESLKKEKESLTLKVLQLEEQIKNMMQAQEISAIKKSTPSYLSPNAREFSPKKQIEVPVVSVKGITDEPQEDLPENHEEESSSCNTETVPLIDESQASQCDSSATEQNKPEVAVEKVTVSDDGWNEDFTNPEPEVKIQPDSNQRFKQDRFNPGAKSTKQYKRRGSNHENSFQGQDVREKSIKSNDYGYQTNSRNYNKKGGSLYQKNSSNTRTGTEAINSTGAENTEEPAHSEGPWKKTDSKHSRYNRGREDHENTNYRHKNREDVERREGEFHQNSRYHGGKRSGPWRQQNHNVSDGLGHTQENTKSGHFNSGPWSGAQPLKDIVKEIDGDLFTAPPEYSLGHCVAQDLRMGSGIAVKFRQEFKRVGELMNQNVEVGGCAHLEDKTNDHTRYVFYLVTKAISSGKPTVETMRQSLKALHDKCKRFGVTKLALPRIGCGLDKLDWETVKRLINTEFQDTEIEINVYNFNVEGVPESEMKKPGGPRVTYKIMRLNTIDSQTALLFFGTENGHVDSTAASLDEKFHFIHEYKRSAKTVGKAWCWSKSQDYYIYSLIVSKSFVKDSVSFATVEECCRDLSKQLKQDTFGYVGLECFTEWSDDSTFTEKVVTLLRSSLPKCVYELWVCYREEKEDIHKMCEWFASKQRNQF